MKKEKVLVLMGGTSEERQVSLRSGKAVFRGLEDNGYEVAGLDFNPESLQEIQNVQPDVVFIALHGKKGEDGTVQGLLETMGIPYTGSGVASSAICMDKGLSKKLFQYEGIPTADFIMISKESFDNSESFLEELENKLALPVVIKATNQGSSIGTYIARQRNDIIKMIEAAFEFNDEVIVEKFIDGIELTAAVLGNEEHLVLPLIEISSENEFYDFESKYTPGMCNHIIPARIEHEAMERVKIISEKTYKAMGCKGFARVDLIIDKKGNPFVLEVNTVPGMTEMSLVPDAAAAAGISFNELLDKIVQLALEYWKYGK